jgi:hypothetical protein
VNQFPESARRRMQAQSAGEHPDADLLTAFSEHSLTTVERQQVLSHLAVCSTCREVVVLAMPDSVTPEVLAPARQSWFRWPMLRWTAVAATAVVVWAAVAVLVPRKQSRDVSVPVQQTASTTKPAEPLPAAPVAKQNEAVATSNSRSEAKKSAVANKSESQQESRQLASADAQAKEKNQPPARDAKTADSQLVAGLRADHAAPSTEADTAKADKVADERFKDVPAAAEAGAKGAAGAIAGRTAQTRAAVVAQAPPPGPPPPPPAAQNAQVNALREGEMLSKVQVTAAAPMARAKSTDNFAPIRWRVSSTGAIEHSPDGKTWEKTEIDPGVTFRAMSSNGPELWAGGSGGALFHSADAGRTWTRVKVSGEGMWVTDNITAVDFPSMRMGIVTTALGAIWTTQDGGATWQRKQ